MIFPWLFEKLPGPRWLKLVQLLALLALVVFTLFEWVFPTLDGVLSEPTVESFGNPNIASNLIIRAEGQN